jgi:hypothetical protein
MHPNLSNIRNRRSATVTDERLSRWLAEIYDTNGFEIDCNHFQASLPAYVEREVERDFDLAYRALTNDPLVAAVARIQDHLAHCPDCMEEYQALREVVTLELDGGLPEADEILATLVEEDEPAPAVSVLAGARRCP